MCFVFRSPFSSSIRKGHRSIYITSCQTCLVSQAIVLLTSTVLEPVAQWFEWKTKRNDDTQDEDPTGIYDIYSPVAAANSREEAQLENSADESAEKQRNVTENIVIQSRKSF